MGKKAQIVAVSKSDDDSIPDGKELLAIDVGEVSLVKKAANKKKFTVTKQDDDDGETAPSDTDGEDKVITVEVAKAVAPLLTQIAEERIALITSALDSITAMLSAGTLTRDDAWKMFGTVYSLLYKAETDVTSIADALSLPVIEVVQKQDESRGRKALKEIMKQIAQEEGGMGTKPEATKPTETKKSENEPAATSQDTIMEQIGATVSAAVSKAVAPLEERLTALETPAAKTEPVAKSEEKPKTPTAEDIAALVSASVTKTLEPVSKSIEDLGKRLDTLEGVPASADQNGNTVPVSKSGDDDDLWADIV